MEQDELFYELAWTACVGTACMRYLASLGSTLAQRDLPRTEKALKALDETGFRFPDKELENIL